MAVPVGPWEQGGCFENAVASHGHGGTALWLRLMEIKLLLTVMHERFKTQAKADADADTHTHTDTQMLTTFKHNFLCLKSKKC